MSTHTAELRYARELAARDAADQLLDVIAQLERAAILLVQAGQPSLHHRSRTLQAAAERLQTDVAGAIGDLVRERVIEDLSRRAERPAAPSPTLSVA